MAEWYFMVCRTCKAAELLDGEEIPGYIEDHEGHSFTILTPGTREDDDLFRTWFLGFMGWPVKEET